MAKNEENFQRYSVSLVTQGKHRFYTLTMPSDVLARTCFVTTRDKDPKKGFQRILNKERAQEIANYIDEGFGSIPNSIVLSAQADAELKIIGKGKTLEFKDVSKAFLILDGQHRVYGFSLAKKELRVPVVIYNNLSRQDETRLFIDINTKQRPVPNELLLDIKRLADYESDQEKSLSEIFESFSDDKSSPLFGLMSKTARTKGKISHVTFNRALKPLLKKLGEKSVPKTYKAIAAYVRAFTSRASEKDIEFDITHPSIFRAIMMLFPDITQRVQDKYSSEYTTENFEEILFPLFENIRPSLFKRVGSSPKPIYEGLIKAMQSGFSL